MKKKTILMSLPLLLTMILSACNRHTHTFSESWSYDETNHWHECECGEKEDENPHEWGEGVVTKEATCTEAGELTYTCVCGAIKTESLTELGHDANVEWQYDETYHWHSCKNQGCYDELEKAAHDMVEDLTKHKDSTCTEYGSKTSVCSVCGYELTEQIPLVEHTWDEGVVTTEPTCEEEGSKTYTCSECGRTRTETIEALGHTWEPMSSNEAYQYNSIGTWEQCSRCHVTRNLNITTTAPWAAFDLDGDTGITVEHPDGENAWDKTTHTLTTSTFKKDDGVIFTIGDLVDGTRKIVEITLTVDGTTAWGAQASLWLFDENAEQLNSIFCLKTNPFLDFDATKNHSVVTAIEDGHEVTSLSAQGVEFTYRFDFRTSTNLPRFLVINGANGQEATPDVISVKSIVLKETICGHKATEVIVGAETESTCSAGGHIQYVCGHEGCNSVEYSVEKDKLPHTPITVTSDHTIAEEFYWSGSRVECSVCGAIIDDSGVTGRAPWFNATPVLESDNLNPWYSSIGSESSYNPTNHTFSTARDDFLVVGISDTVEASSRNYLVVTITITKGAGTSWGPDLYFGVNYNTGTKLGGRLFTPNILMGSNGWENNPEELQIVNAETGSSMKGTSIVGTKVELILDVSSIETIKQVYFGTSLSDVQMTIDSIIFKETPCSHGYSSYSTTINTPVHATCANADVYHCTVCDHVWKETNLVWNDGCEEQNLSNTSGIRGGSVYYNANAHVVPSTCTNQMGPMFAIPTTVDAVYLEMKTIVSDVESQRMFVYVGSKPSDISWSDRYTLNLYPNNFATDHSPATSVVGHMITDGSGYEVSSYANGDVVVLKLDIAAIREAGFTATSILVGTLGGMSLELKSLVYHTAS